MEVKPLAWSCGSLELSNWIWSLDHEAGTYPDLLGEYAGRICYQSLNRPNPATATNQSYLANIIDQEHFSVLEHASMSFVVKDVSRHLLGELTRHRHLSYSVESLRFCVPRTFARHPAVAADPVLLEELEEHWELCLELYTGVYDRLRAQAVPLKKARETAAQWLPLCTATDLVVTGNLRAWRDVVQKRLDPAANEEIRELAGKVLNELKGVASNSFQDMETV